MKRISIIIAVACIALVGFQMSARTNFSGTWTLDLKKSKNLPVSFNSIESYTFVITQNADSLVGIATMVGASQKVTLPPMRYLFNGREEYTEDSLRFVKRWSRAEWATTGTKLIIHKRSIQGSSGHEQRSTQTDVWQLRNRSTLILNVTQKFETGDSMHNEQRVFHRVR
jgi:hypothetical protein